MPDKRVSSRPVQWEKVWGLCREAAQVVVRAVDFGNTKFVCSTRRECGGSVGIALNVYRPVVAGWIRRPSRCAETRRYNAALTGRFDGAGELAGMVNRFLRSQRMAYPMCGRVPRVPLCASRAANVAQPQRLPVCSSRRRSGTSAFLRIRPREPITRSPDNGLVESGTHQSSLTLNRALVELHECRACHALRVSLNDLGYCLWQGQDRRRTGNGLHPPRIRGNVQGTCGEEQGNDFARLLRGGRHR
jgi:hypothetical protein